MSYRRLLVLYAIILLLVAAQTYSSGEDSHGTAGAPDAAEGTPRPDADTELSNDIVRALAKLFPMFTEAKVKEYYGSTLPKAFDDLKKGNEDGIADVIAQLFGTLNPQQVEKLIADVDAELKTEGEKPKEKQDVNKIALLKRLKEAALAIKKQDGDKELNKFREAFNNKFKDVRDKNTEFTKLLDEALTNDAAKRKLLAGGYDPELLLRFAKEQCATGNQSLCDKLAKGLTFEDAKTGDRFIDVVNSDNKNQRLVIPKGSDFKDSLADISDQTKGFAGFKLAANPHETVEQANIIRPKKAVGGKTSPSPTKDDGKKTPDLTRDPAPPRKNPEGNGTKPDDKTKPSPGQTDKAKLEEKKAAVAAIAKVQCVKCHGANSKQPTKFDANGKLLTPETKQAVLDHTTKVKDMPMGGTLTAAELDTIKEWAKLQGLN